MFRRKVYIKCISMSFIRPRFIRFLKSLRSVRVLLYIYIEIIIKYNRLNLFFLDRDYTSSFYLSLPCRQHCFSILNFIGKDVNLTSGMILNFKWSVSKCLKRSTSSNSVFSLYFKRFYFKILFNIYLYIIKNFNYRQYIFFLNFFEKLKPNILYFVHKHSYLKYFKPKRRIKRSVLRLILSNS